LNFTKRIFENNNCTGENAMKNYLINVLTLNENSNFHAQSLAELIIA